jgi:hypothetical protein
MGLREFFEVEKKRKVKERLEQIAFGEIEVTPQEMAALKILIEYEEPKLGRMGALPDAETFASRLEAALKRSAMSKTPPARPPKLIEYHPRKDPE